MSDIQPTRTQLVRALAKPGAEILATLTPEKVHLLHMAVGLAGEAGELLAAVSEQNALEEIGDALFYVEGLLQGLDSTLEEFPFNSATEYGPHAISISACDVLDFVKKHVIYNKEIEQEKILNSLQKCVASLFDYAEHLGFNDAQIHADNLKKLGKRYEGLQYSDAAAHARADKA